MIRPTKRSESAETKTESGIVYRRAKRPRWGEKLARNFAFAGILTLSVVAVRNAELPTGKTVLTAVQEMIDMNWDESLGKISFVSNLLPESMAVFFESDLRASLTAPCFGEVVHVWSEEEPYLGYNAARGNVYAVSSGQVMSIAHGPDEERIVRVRHENGLESMYYNLASVNVREGDEVTADTCLGEAMPGRQALLEVRRAGLPIDPAAFLTPRGEATP
ncbi:MAG: M23 family metallopeptidase [Clostridia bacterium]|nr:M23 family metallopeptidase [Clostridia bacterium]